MNKKHGSYKMLLAGGMWVVSLVGVAAEPEMTIAELLHQPGHQQTWKKALNGQKEIPVWVRKGQGPSTPATPVDWQGQRYLVGEICKTHDCGNNFVYIALSEENKEAWGLRVEVANKPEAIEHPSQYAKYQWLGKPNESVKALLHHQVESNPNWR